MTALQQRAEAAATRFSAARTPVMVEFAIEEQLEESMSGKREPTPPPSL